ncbi:MAG TPA: ISAs1 family transposase [Planctomycetaceae bacterium]|nr:ISAs1 family transposase [Planctomycetaceae bacterium]
MPVAWPAAASRDAFISWARSLCKSTEGKLVAIDGKTVRGAFADGSVGALHLINAWVVENSMVLGQYATDVKSNEITAIVALIRLLDLKGAVVSIDAMGCGLALSIRHVAWPENHRAHRVQAHCEG